MTRPDERDFSIQDQAARVRRMTSLARQADLSQRAAARRSQRVVIQQEVQEVQEVQDAYERASMRRSLDWLRQR